MLTHAADGQRDLMEPRHRFFAILQNAFSMHVGPRLDINELKARQGEPLAQAKC
jgi:hypothetical protein